MPKHSPLTRTAPADQSAPAPAAAAPSGPAAPRAGAIHVLIVDDESVIRTAVRTALEDAGYVVHEAADGVIAMDVLRVSPQPLVVVLDLMMPRMSGTEVLEFLAAEPVWAQRHSVIVLTAVGRWLTSKHLQPLLEHFAISLVGKPFDVEDLLAVVAAAAHRLPPA